jgi:hypothetical protein
MHSRTARVEIEGSGTSKPKPDRRSQHPNRGFGRRRLRQVAVAQCPGGNRSGHGVCHIAPSEEAKIDLSGSGDVYLHSNPKQLETEVGGSRPHSPGRSSI